MVLVESDAALAAANRKRRAVASADFMLAGGAVDGWFSGVGEVSGSRKCFVGAREMGEVREGDRL